MHLCGIILCLIVLRTDRTLHNNYYEHSTLRYMYMKNDVVRRTRCHAGNVNRPDNYIVIVVCNNVILCVISMLAQNHMNCVFLLFFKAYHVKVV